MRKILITLCLLFVCYGFTKTIDVEAASKKHQENMVVEEEYKKENKKKKKKSQISCGYEEAIRVAGFVTNAPFGWVNIIPPRPPKPMT